MSAKILKPADYFLMVLVAGLILFLSIRFFFLQPAGQRVVITGINGSESYPLKEDRTIEVEGPLGVEDVVIRDGEVWMENSPCRNKICIKMGRKKRVGEQIICLPNRIVVEIEGEDEGVDGITR